MNCARCELSKTRTNIVLGDGELSAPMLVLGEAPGRSEDVLGKVCIGEGGKVLNSLLSRAGIPLEKCFFLYMVFCRPCDSRKGENREPKDAEVLACLNNVLSKIAEMHNLKGIVFAGKNVKKWYGTRLKGLPNVAVTNPSALARSGGAACSLFRDNLNALKEFHEKIKD